VSSCTEDAHEPARDAASDAGHARDANDADGAVAGFQPAHVLTTDKLAVLAGTLYTPAPGQGEIGFYGTDLGVAFEHHGELRILFGDTWRDATGALIGTARDDAEGVISLQAAAGGFPDGDAVDAFVESQPVGAPLGAEEPWWRRAGPPVSMHVEAGQAAPYELVRAADADEALLDMGLGKAVVAAWSDGRDGAFAIFRRDVAIACSGGTSPSCEDGFECDRELGACTQIEGEYAQPCVLGSDRCGPGGSCEPVEGGGYCQDRTSSMYGDGGEDGRLDSVVVQHEVGRADPTRSARYVTQAFVTNKFLNPIAKAVADFDPDRDDPGGNDYRPADGTQPAREKVLLWGRPHTAGIKADGRDARLYFAYVDMGESGDAADFAWSPRYFAGTEAGRPRFSERQVDAVALELGGSPLPESELYDVVDKTAITYLAPLHQWVMLYGGDFAPFFLRLFAGPNFQRVQRDPEGAIHARFAEHPWGPWSEPVTVLAGGDPSVSPPAPASEYGPLGMLHHADCIGPDCIPGENAPSHVLAPYGFLYAPNIFDPWTELRQDGDAVDIYWNVSTWNPYQTVLLRTRIER
jgi:hypothetical protein